MYIGCLICKDFDGYKTNLQNVPDENKEDFRQEVIQNMIDRMQQPDGTCFEMFRRINFYAKK